MKKSQTNYLADKNSFSNRTKNNFKTKIKRFCHQTLTFFIIYVIVFQSIIFLSVSNSYGQTAKNIVPQTGGVESTLLNQTRSLIPNVNFAALLEGSNKFVSETVGSILSYFSEDEISSASIYIENAVTAYGPKQFLRTKGKPNNYVETFTLPQNCIDGTYKIVVKNGEANGSNRISSSTITINQVEIFRQSDFNQNVYQLEKPVTLLSNNTLEINLSSPPNSYLTIEIIGENCGQTDSIPPQLAITSPQDNFATTGEAINISGTADDTGENSSGIARILVNNNPSAYNAVDKTWQFDSLTLTSGTNEITVKAIDNAGNETTSRLVVIRDLTAPVISISSPTNSAVIQNASVNISGNASDSGTSNSGIERITVNGNAATFDLLTGNWSLADLSLSVGSNTITAIAFDNAGNQKSAEITVTRIVNQSPMVEAGSNQTIELPNSAALSGTVNDDGYPVGSSIAVNWSKASGPGDVTFSNQNNQNTTAGFSTHGTYILRLTATDGDLTANDDVIITVNPQNQAPTVNAGEDQVIELPDTVNLSGTADDDGYPQGSNLTTTWSQVNGNGTVDFANINSPNTTASFSQTGDYTLRLTATDGQLSTSEDITITVNPENQAPVVNAGADQEFNLPQTAELNGTATDDGYPQNGSLSYTWSKITGNGEITFSSAVSPSTTASFTQSGTYTIRLTVSDGRISGNDDLTIIVRPVNQAPTVNAGDDQTIAIGETADLNGSVTDDGEPLGGDLTKTWSKKSGPGVVTFANPNSQTTTAGFSEAGTYVLRLVGSDSELSISDEITVTVLANNQPPTVAAGVDQTINLPLNTINLSGTVNDDGLPLNTDIVITWTKQSGVGNVTFSNAGSAITTAVFDSAGIYVLRLTASDTEFTVNDEITIEVIPENTAPVVDAGVDQIITLPNTVTVAGAVSDDGLPAGSNVEVSWSKVSGDGTVAFVNANSKITEVSFSQAGTYVLRLTATDGELSKTDDITITVKPENQPPTVDAGIDQTIRLPQSAQLSGTAEDDGNPEGETLSVVWSKESGPGDVVLGSPNLVNTSASFSVEGVYVLKLEAADSELTTSDTVTVTVENSGSTPTADFVVPENGGPIQMSVADVSSTQSASYIPERLLDENNSTTWNTQSSASGTQFATFELAGGEQLVNGFRLQLYRNHPSSQVKDFIVQVSRTTTDNDAFSTVLSGSLQNNEAIQEFFVSDEAVFAKYIKLILVNTHAPGTNFILGTFQTLGMGGADNIVSLPGKFNLARNDCPSLFINGASIARYSSFAGQHPTEVIRNGTWQTKTTENEFVVIKLAGDKSYNLEGVRMPGNYIDYHNKWYRDFEIWVSDTIDEDSAYIKVLEAVKTSNEIQDYIFPGGSVSAKYVKFVPKSSRDGATNGTIFFQGALEVLTTDEAGIHSFSSEHSNGRVGNVLDTSFGSYWYAAPNQTTNQWIKFRVGGSQKVYGVAIGGNNSVYEYFGPKNYEIRVSNTTADDAAFTTVKTGVLSPTRNIQEVRFDSPVEAKYVQFYWVDGYSTSWNSVYTLKILALASDGAALLKTSSVNDVNSDPSQILNLDQTQIGWESASNQNVDQSLTLSLYNNEVRNINRVSLRPGWVNEFGYAQPGMSPKDFEIQVSTTDEQDSSFTTVFSGTLQAADKLQHFYFDAIPARYVRLLIRNNYGHSRIGLKSFYVYSSNVGSTEAKFFDNSTDEDSNIVSYEWDFGDGSSSTDKNPTHNYEQEGEYTVRLTVTDSGGLTNTTEKHYRALPPLKADFAYSPLFPLESGSGQMSVRFVDKSSSRLSLTNEKISLTTNGTSFPYLALGNVSYLYQDSGVYPTTVQIGSNYHLTYKFTKNITVTNLAPNVNAGEDRTVYWGQTWAITPTNISDPSPVDQTTLTGTWNFGDGASANCTNCTVANATVNHSYDLPGTYTATLTINDKDGAGSSDSAVYTVIKRPTSVTFQNPTRETQNNLTVRGTLLDTFANTGIGQKVIRLNINGVDFVSQTDANGNFVLTIPFGADSQFGKIISYFDEDDLYQSSSNIYSVNPDRNKPTTDVPTNGGTDFWISFPANYLDLQNRLALLVTSTSDTNGTIYSAGCGINKTFQVTANTVTRVELDKNCQSSTSDQIQNFGIRVTSQEPIILYGLNERSFTTDAFLALPVNTLGKEYIVLAYANTNGFSPASQFSIVAAEDNTSVEITPVETTGTRQAGIPYQITLNQGQSYLLKNTIIGKDITGSSVTADKPIAVFGSHASATVDESIVCCSDHLVEQLPPVNTWGRRFVIASSLSRTKGDFFRFVAAYDNTAVYLNGARKATLKRGEFYQELINSSTEVISTEPILVGQFATSSGFDSSTNGADPFMSIVPPYSQFLSQYTLAAQQRFTNYLNLAVPNSIIGQISLDGNILAESQFSAVGSSGFSVAKIPVAVGTHNINAPAPIGVFSYGYTTDEGYGYPGGMSLIPKIRGESNISVSPETLVRFVNNQACLNVSLTDDESNPIGGKNVSFSVSGVNQQTGNGVTNASGQIEFCYTGGANAGADTFTANFESVSKTASVVWSLSNQKPAVNAGDDQTITLPSTATLNGTVSDDGLPNNSLNVNWSKVSGSGEVTFINPDSSETIADFSLPGTYVLRLTATDGELTTTDDIAVTVNPEVVNQAPTADAGADQTVTLNANLVQNPSAEADLINNEIPSWTQIQGSNWTRVGKDSANNYPLPRFGQYYFYPGEEASAELRQDIDVRAYADAIDAGTQQFSWKAFVRSMPEANPDSARVIFEYRDAANQNTIASLDSGEITTTNGWHETSDLRVPPPGTGFIRIRLIATRNSGTTNDVFFEGLNLRAFGGTAAVKLSGETTDDGLPAGSTLLSNWTVSQGGGNVVFGNANSADTTAIFDAAGTYVLNLAASDGELSANDNTTVTVLPSNQAPTVDAGTDAGVTLPNNLQLNGTASDDSGTPPNVRWEKVSGAGIVTFDDADSLNTNVSFSLAGTYVLKLRAEDGDLDRSDEITVTVDPAPTNQPPVVSTGGNQNIILPTNSVTLSGEVTDDGLPSNNLTIEWSKTSGDGNVVFANANSANTTATFDAAGSYVLRLTASDGQYTAWRETVITVSPEGTGGENQAPTVDVGADQTITLSQTTILEADISDDGLPLGGSFSANWTKVSGDGNVAFSNPNQTATYATFSQTGTYVLRLTVSDSELTNFDELTVTVVDNQSAPTVQIITPDDGAEVSEPLAITGNVSGGDWKVDYALQTSDSEQNLEWVNLSQGTGAVSGNLAEFDTSLLLNGLYAVRLMTADQFGQTSTDIISVSVENNLKVGHFTLSFEDLSVPVAGIPIQVIRTYDSRDKRRGDFGIGWTLGIKNVRLEKNGVLGLRWQQTSNGAFIPTYCINATRPHIVTVTMPDGMVEKFEAKTERECQQGAPITDTRLIFRPQAGTQGKLETTTPSDVRVAGSVPGQVELIGYDGQGIFNSARFKYISKEGTEFIIDQLGGLQSVRDLNNNTLTVSASGITHSSGKSISFGRDSQGRIASVTDPNGAVQTYTYDVNGDLITHTDRESNATKFTYFTDPAHHLKDIEDPRGIQPIRNEYDADGRLSKHIDANGNEINYTHNLAARIETVSDRLGNTTTFEYDNRGNVLRQTDAKGGVKEFSYDGNDNVLTERDELGRTTTYTYDQFDNRTSVTDNDGKTSTFTYNNLGQVLTMTDAKGNVATNTYNSTGSNLLTTTDALGNTTTYTYSIQTGQRTSVKDAQDNVTSFEYAGNYLTKETDAQGNETTFGYDANGNRSAQTVRRTNAGGQIETITTTFEYDNLNRLTKTTLADGTFTRVEYNQIGQQAATIDQAGNRTEFEYDSMGRLIKTTYADATFEESTFDAEGRRLTSKDRLGRVTSYQYDELGRLTRTTYADGTFTETAYDAAGQVLTSTDAGGNTTTFGYDDLGRRETVKNALNQMTAFAYDNNGNQTSMTDALGRVMSYQYDKLNRRTKTIFDDSTFTETTYDTLGRRISEKDQAGKVTQFAYDSLGRLTKVTDALDQETRYEYNEIGQQIKQIDALNRTTRYEYDKLGRRTKRILPMGQVETYSYNNRGNLEARTDFNGKTTSYNYDIMNRLLAKVPDASLSEPTVSYTYNNQGQRQTMTDASGTTSYTYDVRNRMASKQTPFGTLSYTYNDTGNIESLRSSNSNGVTVDYSYDQLNRLETVKDNNLTGNQTTSYNYDAVGNLKSYNYPNQVTTNYNYNNLNRLTSMTIANPQNALASYNYTLGASGNRTQVIENGARTVNYTYDDLYRLTSETISGLGQVTYGYDAVGNRLQRNSNIAPVPTQSSTFDNNDRLNSDTYDANGNTKQSNGRTFSYDYENKLTSTSDGITIVYDGDGNRVSKTVNGVTTNYLVDTNNLTGYAQVVEELQNGNVVKQYTYGHDLISQNHNGVVSFYNYDGHGSVRQLTDNLGSVTDTYTYDAFGNIISQTGTTDNNYLYAGEQFDSDLGFYYNRARYLNVYTGRFISQDTYEGNRFEPKGLHKYTYAENDAVNNIDPSGNSIQSEIQALAIRATAFIGSVGPAIQRAFTNGTIGNFWQKLGQRSEQFAEAVLALKPNLTVTRNIPVANRFIDFFVKNGERTAFIEVKYSLPSKVGPSMTRLVGQVNSAASSNQGQVVLWTLKEPTQNQVRLVVSQVNNSQVQFVHGVEGLYKWIHLYFGV